MFLALTVAVVILVAFIAAVMASPRPEVEQLCSFCALNTTRDRCPKCQLPVCESCDFLHQCNK